MIEFNYYSADIKKTKPLGTVTLERFIEAIRNPKKKMKNLFDEIRYYKSIGDKKKADELKTSLYSFTPCVMVSNRRNYESILNFTGLMVLDFDNIDPELVEEFKHKLFKENPEIIATWLSSSALGVRALVKIPVANSVKEFQQYFEGFQIKRVGKFNWFDTAPKNAVLPLFLSYDPKILYRNNPTTWKEKYKPLESKPVKQFKIADMNSNVTDIIKSKIDKITSNGHPQLRAAAFLLGGYVGGGHIIEDQAEQLINNLIDSNNYLKIKPDVYKTTAKQMIKKGQNQPIYLKK